MPWRPNFPPGCGPCWLNVLGHLTPGERGKLWSEVARRLEDGGAVCVNNAPPHTPMTVPSTLMSTFRAGQLDYEGWASTEPSGPERLTWRMTYRTLRDGQCLTETTADYEWWVASDEVLRAEWAAHGLAARTADEGEASFHVVGHAAGSSR